MDGPGLRTVIFFSGCSVGCKRCHNAKYRNKYNAKHYSIGGLVQLIRETVPLKKITISGGEPMEQEIALSSLIELIPDFDIGLYTSYKLPLVPPVILSRLRFIKTGQYDFSKNISSEYFGSSNQELIDFKYN